MTCPCHTNLHKLSHGHTDDPSATSVTREPPSSSLGIPNRNPSAPCSCSQTCLNVSHPTCPFSGFAQWVSSYLALHLNSQNKISSGSQWSSLLPRPSLLTQQHLRLQLPASCPVAQGPAKVRWPLYHFWHCGLEVASIPSQTLIQTRRASAAPQGPLRLESGKGKLDRANKEGLEREQEKHPRKCSQKDIVPKGREGGAVVGVGRVTHQSHSFRGLEKQRGLDPRRVPVAPLP